MFIDRFSVAAYALFWLLRLNGCLRRGRQPLLRGREWFFGVHVHPDFYRGPGRRILHRYWMRMLVPFMVDIPIAAFIFLSHRLWLLNALIVSLSVLIHITHVFSVNLAEREARSFRVADPVEPATCTLVSLERRRLRDYSNYRTECALLFLLLAAFGSLIAYYYSGAEHPTFRLVFGIPVILLYLQAGLLLVKLIVVRWRTPIPRLDTTEYIEAREKARRYFLWTCDFYRSAGVITIIFWAVQLWTPADKLGQVVTLWLSTGLFVSVFATIWVEVKRKQVAAAAIRARPVTLPDFLQQHSIARWPLCYQPSAPMLILNGARGLSFNLAHHLNRLSAGYLVGLILLIGLVRFLH